MEVAVKNLKPGDQYRDEDNGNGYTVTEPVATEQGPKAGRTRWLVAVTYNDGGNGVRIWDDGDIMIPLMTRAPAQSYPVQKPGVASIVHYRSYGTPGGDYTAECRAALVTEVKYVSNLVFVGLGVINPTGMFFKVNIPYDKNGEAGGSWHWPCEET